MSNFRLDERVSARRILAALVAVTLVCGLLVTLLTYSRVTHVLKNAGTDNEARLLVQSSGLLINAQPLGQDIDRLSSTLESLLASSSLIHTCLKITDGSRQLMLPTNRRVECDSTFRGSSQQVQTVSRRSPGREVSITLSYGPSRSITMFSASVGETVFSTLLMLVFVALIAVLIYLTVAFANWVFDELQSTVGGARAKPPSILQNIKILELEQVWDTVEKLNAAIRGKALFDISTRVAHDIRSPLSALNMVLGSLANVAESKRLLIRNAANRINDIANDLVREGKAAKAHLSVNHPPTCGGDGAAPVMIVGLVDAILSEKRMQYRSISDLEIHSDFISSYGLFACISVADLSRSVSNLIDNAVQSLKGPGRVVVSIRNVDTDLEIAISDNGRGIPKDILARVGECGFSYGKDAANLGLGLGVATARQCVEAGGGSLSIQSKENVGTIVRLRIPKAPAPGWFLEDLNISNDATVVTIDDDQTIHQVWEGRLKAIGFKSRHLKFTCPDRFKIWLSKERSKQNVYLFDYEFLGHDASGLDVILNLELLNQSVLVTSRFDEAEVIARVLRNKMRVLPKTLVGLVPISLGPLPI